MNGAGVGLAVLKALAYSELRLVAATWRRGMEEAGAGAIPG